MNTPNAFCLPRAHFLFLPHKVIGEKYFAENYAFSFGIGFAFNQGGTLKHDVGGNLWPNSQLPQGMGQALILDDIYVSSGKLPLLWVKG